MHCPSPNRPVGVSFSSAMFLIGLLVTSCIHHTRCRPLVLVACVLLSIKSFRTHPLSHITCPELSYDSFLLSVVPSSVRGGFTVVTTSPFLNFPRPWNAQTSCTAPDLEEDVLVTTPLYADRVYIFDESTQREYQVH